MSIHLHKPVIVSGEASETESDEDDQVYERAEVAVSQIKGQEITGEDSESENETDGSISSASIATPMNTLRTSDEVKPNNRTNSLLHQKLHESNSAFYNNLEDFINNVVGDAEKSLSEVDQQILRSQLVVQGASTSLKSFNSQASTLKKKLHTLLSSNFLSNVKVLNKS